MVEPSKEGGDPTSLGWTANGFPGVPIGQKSGRGKHGSQAWSPCDYWLEGRGCGHHRMQCQEDRSTGAGAGLCTTATSGFPPAAGCRAQELPEVGEAECTCASSPTLAQAFGESQGLQGPPKLGE